MVRTLVCLAAVSALLGCGSEEEGSDPSAPVDPTVVFELVPPDVDTGWPDVPDPADTDEPTN